MQPIKVRPLSGQEGKYEIVFGHRRHQACLELGLPVLAMIEDLSEQDLFAQMDRENRDRKDLRPFEQGMMYAKALNQGLFPSMRKMTDALGVENSNISKAVSLARLPNEVIAAFASPLDLQQNWAPSLTKALQNQPDTVIAKAKVLSQTAPRPKATDIFRLLTDIEGGAVSDSTQPSHPLVIKGKGDKAGQIQFNPKKKAFEITLTGVSQDSISEIEKIIKEFLS